MAAPWGSLFRMFSYKSIYAWKAWQRPAGRSSARVAPRRAARSRTCPSADCSHSLTHSHSHSLTHSHSHGHSLSHSRSHSHSHNQSHSRSHSHSHSPICYSRISCCVRMATPWGSLFRERSAENSSTFAHLAFGGPGVRVSFERRWHTKDSHGNILALVLR